MSNDGRARDSATGGRHRVPAKSLIDPTRLKVATSSVGLALALCLTPLSAWAQEGGGEGTGSSSQGDQGTGSEGQGTDESGQGSGDAGEQSSEGSGSEGSSGEQTGEGSGKKSGGNGYGGRATGPSTPEWLAPTAEFPVPEAPVNESLPEEVDVVDPLQRNMLCDPVDKPGLEAFMNVIGEHYGRPGHSTSRSCIEQRSEHYDGRAVDWALNASDPADRRIGDAAVRWLSANDGEMAKRFGIQSIIWNSHSWRPNGQGWQGYAGQSAHTDHVHFSFTWDGAMMRTSWWTGVALTTNDVGPCATVAGAYAAIPQGPRTEPCAAEGVVAEPNGGYADVLPGGTGAGLDMMQARLEVPPTGELDAPTREALLVWQTKAGVPQTGVLDQLTYLAAQGEPLPELPAEALAVPVADEMTTVYTPYLRSVLADGSTGPAVKILQQALGLEADGVFGPKTAAAVLDFTTEHPLLTAQEQTGSALWRVLEMQDYPTLPYRDRVLEVGAEGPDVATLQAQLDLEADGIFGPMTQQAVLDAQAEAGLEPTGVVDGPTWAATDEGIAGTPPPLALDLRAGYTVPWTERD
ncbi:MAG: peptidoglycan-binding domain-containing protein [Ornithinimicrobium sp.]|uniref:peptidoglycan-binding domain-containing protein n=1 Tax=Ornithinimicrobium sp. TaxID=1977084 RepID=UPI003D9B9D51